MSISLVPIPSFWETTGAAPFVVDEDTAVLADGEARAVAELFAQQLRSATGYPLPLTAAAGEGRRVLSFRVDAGADYGEHTGNVEAYRLQVDVDGVQVLGASAHGIFNATQTLRQLLPAAVEVPGALADWQIPPVTIVDGPRFAYRGLMIDVARSFLTVAEMEQIIDLAALVKISRLHLHLTDDQGWRIEITNDDRRAGDTIDYTQLTAVSGGTAMTQWGYEGEPGRTGFYTQADYQHLVGYAAERHITVIPEIDLPGHTIAALAAIPELNTPGACHSATEEQPVCPPDGSGEVGHSYLDPHSEHTYIFARHVLGQLAAITPGEYLHIGGDEPLKMAERYGHEVYLACVGRIVEIVREVGKKPIGWNEVAEVKAGPDVVVQFWQGEHTHIVRAAEEGAKVLLSRGESSYLDQKYHAQTPIGLTWACAGDCDFPLYYSWEPAELVPELTADQIAGVEAPLWAETLRGVSQVLFMAFPRLFAAAELAWSPPRTRDLEDFTERISRLAPRLVLGGGNFYDGRKADWQPALAGYAAPGGDGPVRIARVAAPGGQVPEVEVELGGRVLTPELRVVRERSPVHAGPLIDVYLPGGSGLPGGGSGRVRVGQVSAPIQITSGSASVAAPASTAEIGQATRVPALAEELLDQARQSASGRAMRKLNTEHSGPFTQLVLALREGQGLSEHENPGEATLHILHGKCRLTVGSAGRDLSAGDYLVIPPLRHGLVATSDAVVILTMHRL